MIRLVIDTDPGVDDAAAILMALAHPDVRVEAITTVAGNVPLVNTTANALKILDVAGADVPVFAGASQALIARNPSADYAHGSDGLGESGYPASTRQAQPEHAANALIRLANEAPGQLTLVAIGPLTNLALAVALDPDLPSKYRRLVVMGGAIHAQGNTTPVAEFNTYYDPEAAAMVFEAWKDVTLADWEATMAHMVTPAQVETLCAVDTPKGEFFRRTSANTLAFIEQYFGQRSLFTADSLAMAAAIEPDIVTKAERRYLEVELHGEKTRAQTTVDWWNVLKKEPNAELILEMDQNRLFELILAGLQ